MHGDPAARSENRRTGAPAGAGRALVLGAALLALAVPAASVPIEVFFNASDSVGITPESQTAAAGLVPTRTPDGLILPPELSIVRSGSFGGGTLGPPAEASTSWAVENSSEESFEDMWLVFRGHFDLHNMDEDGALEDNDPLYGPLDAGVFGLEIDSEANWTLFEGSEGVYPAFFLGDLGPGEESALSPDVPVNYIFDGALAQDSGGTNVFPRFKVGYATAPIPEPTTVALLGVGLIGLGVAGRRR